MAEGPEIKVKYTADLSDLKKGSDEAKKEVRSIEPEVKKTGGAVQEMGELFGKASLIAGGTFVTGLLAAAAMVGNANEQVKNLNKAVQISAGTNQNYAQSMSSLQSIADNYHKSIFNLANGFNELNRETRGTINQGENTAQIFDTLVSASDKMGVSVDDTTSSFSGFIDKMKQGTVDSTGLTNEIDKRLYEAFVNVARQMHLTNEELNEVLKTSDEAVATVLPALADEFGRALGEIPQKDAHDLAENVEYANSKLITLLDSLFKVSGAKNVFAQAAEDAGDLLDQLTILSQKQGITGAVLGLMDAGAETLLNGSGFKGPSLNYAREEQGRRKQTPLLGSKFTLPGEIGNYSNGPLNLSAGVNITEEAAKLRVEAEAAANKKLIAEQKRLAAERKRALDEITRQEIYESKQRISLQISEMLAANEAAFRKNNGVVGAVAQLAPRGITTGLDNGLNKTQNFTNQTTGDGSATTVTAIKNMTAAWVEEKAAKDASHQSTIKMNQGLSVLNDELNSIADRGTIDVFSGMAEGLGNLSVDLGSIENIGGKVATVFGDMISQIGKATIAYALTMKGLKAALNASFKNPYVALAVGVVAVAAGAALKATANRHNQAASKGLYTGGIVGGPVGIDNVNARLSPKEMVLTEGHQSKLWNFISGGNSGSMMDSRYRPSGNDNVTGGGSDTLKAEIKADRFVVLVERGKRVLNRYK